MLATNLTWGLKSEDYPLNAIKRHKKLLNRTRGGVNDNIYPTYETVEVMTLEAYQVSLSVFSLQVMNSSIYTYEIQYQLWMGKIVSAVFSVIL